MQWVEDEFKITINKRNGSIYLLIEKNNDDFCNPSILINIIHIQKFYMNIINLLYDEDLSYSHSFSKEQIYSF